MAERFRVTYATLSDDDPRLHAGYETGVDLARTWLGATITGHISPGETEDVPSVEVTSPHDPGVVVSRVRTSTDRDIADAIAASARADRSWAATPWRDRLVIARRVAELISDRSNELAALMSMENGKNRLEALGDVEEAADMIRYYCDQMEANDGYDHPMATLNPAERTRSLLRPHGVWAVICPFNYPMALSAGPAAAALITGNSVVVKPSHHGAHTAAKLFECLREAGVPDGVAVLLPGGDEVGAALVAHPGVAGVTFTGSSAVGMSIVRDFGVDYPKPVMAEMGGKNPAIVSDKADLDAAALGVARSAFGFAGQKCSACSRVYVVAEVYEEFLASLVAVTESLVIGAPTDRDAFVGPVIDAAAVARYREAVSHAERNGRIAVGGSVLGGSTALPGHYLAPTVVTDLPVDDPLFHRELFVPLTAVAAVADLDEALRLANADPAGLTAGFFSREQSEIDRFLDRIEAGVVYVNRPAGATTGAWPGVQPFGGWKRSGSTGKAGGGRYYLPEFMREQSQTVVM
ncbi:1-pyrroline-5-carboxylate dehydrogenase [Stackebrandtia endophytica]|uniref:L-glutamate gamma-semialdehyde dehydrogenase n=1 Tax=Stackebrandtia endophytica TaxID=1496996 RepID=A0A543B3N2_9ACTN|nr:aldehyde dehydrogenase family protein [Stackebrandtia endophytica]TQL79448.1 1-pyrroline-5-carboxylate dehydrogenase [Stackebrandtia endophytica]